MQHPISNGNPIWSRRRFLHRAGMGIPTCFRRNPTMVTFSGRTSRVSQRWHVSSGHDPKPELDAAGNFPLRIWSPAFAQHGVSGIPVSDLFPHLSRCVDELAVIRSMYAELSHMLMNTGTQRLLAQFRLLVDLGHGERE